MAGSFQDLPCSHVAVSPDSSLIAAAFEKIATLWSVQSKTQIRSLPHGKPIISMSFVGRSRLACMNSTHLVVWDLLSLQVLWALQIKGSRIIADRFSERFAVTMASNFLLFNTTSSLPVDVQVAANEIMGTCFVSLESSSAATVTASAPLLLDSTCSLVHLGNIEDKKARIDEDDNNNNTDEGPVASGYQAIFGAKPTSNPAARRAQDLVAPQLNNVALSTASSVYTQPAHIAAPVDRVLCAFLAKLMPQPITTITTAASNESVEAEPMNGVTNGGDQQQQQQQQQSTDLSLFASLASGSITFQLE